MKQLIVLAMLAGLLAAPAVRAETAQQNRMKVCNEDAGKQQLVGEARKAFMSSCLSGEAGAKPAAVTQQQQRMKDCNAEAATKELKGDARKTFMSSCLSGKK